jgi:SAM and SH3 domain-containing protein 1
MYDDSPLSTNNYSNINIRHWYDEPPYESDPDDFLMSGRGAAAAQIQV